MRKISNSREWEWKLTYKIASRISHSHTCFFLLSNEIETCFECHCEYHRCNRVIFFRWILDTIWKNLHVCPKCHDISLIVQTSHRRLNIWNRQWSDNIIGCFWWHSKLLITRQGQFTDSTQHGCITTSCFFSYSHFLVLLLQTVVTGSTDGIGRQYARELASNGMNIVLISRTKSKLQKVAEEIGELTMHKIVCRWWQWQRLIIDIKS